MEKHENQKDWDAAINTMQKVLKEKPPEAEAYVRAIYLLLHILLEEDYEKQKHDTIANLLKQYFDESYLKFSESAEYLFFIGYFIALAEWYFGQDNLQLADQMKERACAIEPDNILFEWSLRFSKSDPVADYLADQLLKYDTPRIEWLRSKGAPGLYLLDVISRNRKSSLAT